MNLWSLTMCILRLTAPRRLLRPRRSVNSLAGSWQSLDEVGEPVVGSPGVRLGETGGAGGWPSGSLLPASDASAGPACLASCTRWDSIAGLLLAPI